MLLFVLLGLAMSTSCQAGDGDAFVAWVRAHATPLPDCTDADRVDSFGAFAAVVGDARVVALGEPAHGAHEPLGLRNCLFRYLVEHQGFTAIALESGLAESRGLQKYVAGGPGDARQLVADSLTWGFGRFGENVELVEWMHRYNADPSHARKIRFYGIDMSGGERRNEEWRNARITLDEVSAYLATTAPKRSRAVRAAIAPFSDRFSVPAHAALSVSERHRLGAVIAGLLGFLHRERRTLIAASSEEDYAWAERNAVLAHQLEAMFRISLEARAGDGDSVAQEARDRAMADNALWALKREGPAGRILLFAHDGHVVNAPDRDTGVSDRGAPRAMGQFLRAALGTSLRIITSGATANGQGLPAAVPPPATLDNAMAASGLPSLVVDIRAVDDEAARSWLSSDQTIGTNFTMKTVLVPRVAFDAMVYFKELTPYSKARSEE